MTSLDKQDRLRETVKNDNSAWEIVASYAFHRKKVLVSAFLFVFTLNLIVFD